MVRKTGKYQQLELLMQYRCPEEIASISSQLFYNGAVKCCGKSGTTILYENFMLWSSEME